MSTMYYYGQDGEIAMSNIINTFGLGTKELRHSYKLNADVFDVVGFIFRDNKTLVIFPKNYYTKSELVRFNQDNIKLYNDIKLLYDVIKKYGETENTNATARSYLGARDGYTSDYPFKAFYEVYDYFQKYGLYKEKEARVVEGASGKISWTETIRKSNKVISGNNLIFSPFYTYKKNYNDVFLTECMAFIIDYTIDSFGDFISMKKTGFKYHFDFLNNIEYVIKQLSHYHSKMFKDTQKQLIQSMIDFFIQFKGKARGGRIHVRIRYFDMIWQTMVNKYLNDCFVGVDTTENKILFDESIAKSSVSFGRKTYVIDASSHQFEVELDHYGFCEHEQYIFDSKYYGDIEELNYKQFVYDTIMDSNTNQARRIITYSALLLPGVKSAKLHLDLLTQFGKLSNNNHQIIEQYLDVKTVMKHYIEN